MYKEKLLILDDKGGAMKKSFRTCAAKKYFEDGIKKLKTNEKIIYNFLMDLVNVFENSKTEVELTNNLKKVFSIFCDIKRI